MSETKQVGSGVVIRNTMTTSVTYVVNLIASLFLVPYILSKLSIDLYGAFALILVIVNYSNLFGGGGAFVKFIAQYHRQDNHKRMNAVANFGLFFYSLQAVIVAGIMLLFHEPLLRLFAFPESARPDLPFLLAGVLAISVLRCGLMVYRSALFGVQRLDILAGIQLGGTVLNVVGTIVALEYGCGLHGLVGISVIAAIYTVICQTWAAFRTIPALRFRPFGFTRQTIMETFGYDLKIQVSRIAEMINNEVDKLLLGGLLSMAAVGFYDLGWKVVPARAPPIAPARRQPQQEFDIDYAASAA